MSMAKSRSPEMFAIGTRAEFADAVERLWGHERVNASMERGFMRHQAMVASYVAPDTPYRGLVLVHGTGSGKTCAAVAAVDAWRAGPGGSSRRVRVITPASLRANFVRGMLTCGSARWRRSSDGVWVRDDSNGVRLDALSTEDRADIEASLTNSMAASPVSSSDATYAFVSQNGLTAASAEALQRNGTFANALIVVDEAHNVGRSMASEAAGSTTGVTRRLYEAVRDAPGAKVLLLTATPMINTPLELAFLVNMVAGPARVQTLRFGTPISDSATRSAVREMLLEHTYVDTADVSANGANVRLVPKGFMFAPNGRLVRDGGRRSGESAIQAVIRELHALTPATLGEVREFEVLPTVPEEFDALFIARDGTLKNANMLARRMMGHVSVYLGGGSDDRGRAYPTVRRNVTDLIPLGETQQREYAIARQYEQKLESRSSGGRDDNPSVFKSYSRVVCNFVFPHERGNRRAFRFESHHLTHEQYERVTVAALDRLRRDREFWTSDDRLAQCAPKFVAMLRRMTRDGSGRCLVYSAFRTWEGIGLFSEALLQRGWRRLTADSRGEFRLESSHGDSHGPLFIEPVPSSAAGQALIAAFNGQIDSVARDRLARMCDCKPVDEAGALVKCVLLSRSGAEGLDLAGVRQVHIMEPHWNEVALDQVKGRAIRMNSHAALPRDQRTVSIYTYVASFDRDVVDRAMVTSAPAAEGADRDGDQGRDIVRSTLQIHDIARSDRGLTSDQIVRQIAMSKARMAQRLVSVIQSAAVDCDRHASATARACYRPGPGAELPSPADPLRDRDDALGEGRKLRVKGDDDLDRDVVLFEGSADVYDGPTFDRGGELRAVGEVTRSGGITWLL